MSSFKSSCASRLFGSFASKRFPKVVQICINRVYVKLMKVDLSEFLDVKNYKSLNELFTRELQRKREFISSDDEFISPCDAYISECGEIKEEKALQIKGFSYRVRELLGNFISKESKDRLVGGRYINFYLSPKDYHRYHVPIDMKVSKAVHIPGKLYPVNIKWLHKISELFIENERVIIQAEDKNGKTHILVLVGALNVGKMTVSFEPSIQTNSDITTPQHYEYQDTYLKRGEEFGYFMMGSTILTFAQKGATTHQIALNQKSRFAQVVGYLR